MMTRREFCQNLLVKAQQRFGKKMGDLDVYYAPEVGVALEFLGLIEDISTLDHIEMTPAYLFSSQDGKYLTYKELVYLLPDDKTTVKDVQQDTKLFFSTDKDLKEKVGDRKYYRIIDAIEGITINELDTVIGYLNLMKEESKKQEVETIDTLEESFI